MNSEALCQLQSLWSSCTEYTPVLSPSLGLQDAGHEGVTTGRGGLSLSSLSFCSSPFRYLPFKFISS
ncbi:hypothetical protein D0469_00980 [Peribacillus saganii]|uniref:Uncharacterized protein n=1 Tax=Peribacillus saganii TaxID=2303992 RepID=A0A372LUP1_9BACI|nr:hypothetical protein D0469_00980 [Peribacillus saganii]